MKNLTYVLLMGLLLFSCNDEQSCDCEGDVAYSLGGASPQEAQLLLTSNGLDYVEWGHFRLNFNSPDCSCAVSYRVCNEEMLEGFETMTDAGLNVEFSGTVKLACDQELVTGLPVVGWVTLTDIDLAD
ncbi:MAG: hypothetical protein Roseis2KO_46800 [Roseivirga sp.]